MARALGPRKPLAAADSGGHTVRVRRDPIVLLLCLALAGREALACSREPSRPPLRFDDSEYVFSGKVVEVVTASPWAYRGYIVPALFGASAGPGEPAAIRVKADEVVNAPLPGPLYDVYVYRYNGACMAVPEGEARLHSLIGQRVSVVAKRAHSLFQPFGSGPVRLDADKYHGTIVHLSTAPPRVRANAEIGGELAYELRRGLKDLREAASDDERGRVIAGLLNHRYFLYPAWDPRGGRLDRLVDANIKDPQKARVLKDSLRKEATRRAEEMMTPKR